MFIFILDSIKGAIVETRIKLSQRLQSNSLHAGYTKWVCTYVILKKFADKIGEFSVKQNSFSFFFRIADVAVLDTSDVYTAGLRFDLIPFISEVYNLPTPEYYVVAVAKEEDDNTDLTYLKNKNTCHTGINTAAGWVYPLAYLISNTWIRGYGCDSVHAAAEYFSKSCIPGALSTEYNTGNCNS